MSAIHPAAAETARASSPEGGIAPRPGGKKKNENVGLAESLFAGILSQAREALGLRATAAQEKAAQAGSMAKALPAVGGRFAVSKAQAKVGSAAERLDLQSGRPSGVAQRSKPVAPQAEQRPQGLDKQTVGNERRSVASKQSESAVRAVRAELASAGLASTSAEAALANAARAAAASPGSRKSALSGARGEAAEDGASGGADGGDTKAGRKGAEARVSVLDLRRSSAGRNRAVEASRTEAGEGAPPSREENPVRKEIVRELGLVTAQAGSGERTAQADKAAVPARTSGDFSSMLAERLREAWNGEIVQAAHIVLKDGGAGTIRLKLRPESLGDVKIELNLSDKSISGKIVVESDEAKSAFERNMAELADAFRQGGFESASLEVSVGSGSGKGSGDSGQPGPAPFFSERLRAADAAGGPSAAGVYARRGNAVDIFA
jgi:flagellar hook-length control protein FliK